MMLTKPNFQDIIHHQYLYFDMAKHRARCGSKCLNVWELSFVCIMVYSTFLPVPPWGGVGACGLQVCGNGVGMFCLLFQFSFLSK